MTKHKSSKHEPDKHDSSASPQAEAAAADFASEVPSTDAGSSPSSTASEPPPVSATEQDRGVVETLRSEIATLKDRELRARAELDNYRKRAAREIDDTLRYAGLPVMRDLLPVLDNVERAIQAAEKGTDGAALLEGVRMMRQQLEEVLQRHHCERIEALHAAFDPHLHHAIMQQPSEEFPPNTVVMVTQNGYQLHDRVVRPSQVIVSSAK